MKKILFIALIALFLIPTLGLAAGTCTQSDAENIYSSEGWTGLSKITFTCTADASDGSFPATATNAANTAFITGKYLLKATTNPGATAPTDNYDITLTDADGVDLMGGTLANRDTANSEEALPYIGGLAYGPQPITGALTHTPTGNSVNSAISVTTYIFSR